MICISVIVDNFKPTVEKIVFVTLYPRFATKLPSNSTFFGLTNDYFSINLLRVQCKIKKKRINNILLTL